MMEPETPATNRILPSMKSGFRYHVGIVKPLLLTLLRNEGLSILVGWTGTPEEAIAAVTADPRNVFVLDSSCDSQTEYGECLGHPLR